MFMIFGNLASEALGQQQRKGQLLDIKNKKQREIREIHKQPERKAELLAKRLAETPVPSLFVEARSPKAPQE